MRIQNYCGRAQHILRYRVSERGLPGIWCRPPLTGKERDVRNDAIRRIALVVLATAGLLFFAVMSFGGAHDSVVGPAGAVILGAFATGCAVNAAWAARSGQRHAWIALATGLGGWAAGNGLWCYVALGGTAPIPASSAAEMGYVVLPLCALGATVLVPNRDDYRFGFGLLLDGLLVASSLFLALGSLVGGRGGPGEHPARRLGGRLRLPILGSSSLR